MKNVEIPSNWTAKDALRTADFLQAVIDAIWATHGKKMYRRWERQQKRLGMLSDARDPDFKIGADDIPF